MRLLDLNPRFIGGYQDGGFRELPSVDGAQGILFLCPVCWQKNGGPVGTESMICWFTNPLNAQQVPDSAYPGPGRWRRDGETLDTLTLGPGVTGARSVMVTNHAHYYVTNGEVTFC
jgi:hypothetical protein